ncbi:MAG: YwaF family protein [Clostridia bacterium]|nr:YwaF family protein [Clostridia bacterium]
MYDFLCGLLSDRKGEIIFTCFGIWHLIFIVFFVALAVLLTIYLKGKSYDKKKRTADIFINISFGLYIADFFLMPFAYGEIDIEKLPFHACTAMCVMCFVSRYNKFFGRFKTNFAALGFISNLVYLIYPAGVMWYGVSPITYRVIQTLCFHGFMSVYCFLVLWFENDDFKWKYFYRDIITVTCMTLWAMLGNFMYNSDEKIYNWFFVIRDPFYILDAKISVYIMPVLNIILFAVVEALVYFIFQKTRRRIKHEA